jgi:transcription initiation factor TFIID subunit 7
MAPPPQPVIKSKAGRVHKPTAKKRANGDIDSDDDDANGPSATEKPQPKKIKLANTPSTPHPPVTPGGQPKLKVKGLGRPPPRPAGEGYDSEAEDCEIDPVIEEQFILRMYPGKHADYIRDCVREKKIGIPKQQGGADLAMKWLDADGGRRCMITVQGQSYAGVLLDLPTIIEGMKTWDKKAMVKSADICQMLLVFMPVASEQEAKTAPLPRAAEKGYRWPHGLTPPMHDCIHRRFRKRLSKMEIQNKDAEVERLLRADKEAQSTKYEFIDESKEQEQEDEYDEEEEEFEMEDGEADAEGEQEDYFGDNQPEPEQPEEDDDDVDALFDEAFAADDMDGTEAAPAVGATEAPTPVRATNGATPVGDAEGGADAVEEDEGESEEDESEEDGEEGEFGDEEGEDGEDGDQRDRIAGVRREIAELEKKKAGFVQQLATSTSTIMKKRLEGNIKSTDNEILLKKRLIGEVPDDD